METNVDMIAQILSVTPRRVQQLAKEGIIPRPKNRGEYAVGPCVQGYTKYLHDLLKGETGNLLTEKTRHTRALAEKTEMEVALLKTELVSVADVEKKWAEVLGAFRSQALAFSARVAVMLAGLSAAKTEERLNELMHELLTDLANWNRDDDAEPSARGDASQGTEAGSPAAETTDQ